MDASRQFATVPGSRGLDADLQLAEYPQRERAGHFDPEFEYRLPLQRAARIESPPACGEPVEPARIAELRNRIARAESRLHDAGSLASRLVRRSRTGRGSWRRPG